MYRIRHSIVSNKPYLPTVGQFNFKGEILNKPYLPTVGQFNFKGEILNKPYLPTVGQFNFKGETLNKPYLPTVGQFSVFPYFKGETLNKPYLPTVGQFNFKGEILNKPYLPTVRQLPIVRQFSTFPYAQELKNTLKAYFIDNKIKDLNRKIKELTREHDDEKKRMKLIHGLNEKSHLNEFVNLRLQNEFDKEVLKKEITRLEKEIAKEKADRNLEIAHLKADRNLEIARLEADRNFEKIKTGYLNLNYLRLKGSVHLRGVFEQWELFSLSSFDGNRTKKWTDYLKANKDVFETFQNFYPNPKEIGVNHVVAEMTGFYRWLSERIHNGYAVGDYVEWRRNLLTPVRNKISEYMCKELNLDYRIIESSEVD
ncbi:hypothetical protein RclHR1_21190003 [Rhizophagus clarus]|uniref:Uncharacterized protein n=1 Tax=Rhizophagus clarus TaxID=94130 RepID=A0A2Z6QUD4_9GLOM|nr:hypothetical protein RclHR1_21190003 [Rhizophagus clarus]